MKRTALLLAAGRATRLGPLREHWAKACVPVAGISPLAHLLPRLRTAGVDEAWVNLHFRPDQVRAEVRTAAPPGLEIHFLEERELLGTGGTLLTLAERLGRLPELVVNAKIYTDFPFARLLDRPEASVVLHPPSPLSQFGGLRYQPDGSLRGLLPRDTTPSPGSQAAVYTGICRPGRPWTVALEQARRAHGPPWCLIRDGLLPALRAGAPCTALLHFGHWCEISTPERVATAAELLAEIRKETVNGGAPRDPAGSASDRGGQ